MKIRKTPWDKRSTYTYRFFDADGKQETITLQPGEDGVTEMDIKMLHALDDAEVYSNIKNLRPPETATVKAEKAEWLEEYKKSFTSDYGYAPGKDAIADAMAERFPKNWNQSLNIHESDDEEGDTSDRHPEMAAPNTEDDLPDEVEKLKDIIASCTEKQQQAYRLVYVEGMTEAEAGAVMGCTHQGVHKHLALLIKKVKENF